MSTDTATSLLAELVARAEAARAEQRAAETLATRAHRAGDKAAEQRHDLTARAAYGRALGLDTAASLLAAALDGRATR